MNAKRNFRKQNNLLIELWWGEWFPSGGLGTVYRNNQWGDAA